MYVRMYVCMYVCTHACMYVSIYLSIHLFYNYQYISVVWYFVPLLEALVAAAEVEGPTTELGLPRGACNTSQGYMYIVHLNHYSTPSLSRKSFFPLTRVGRSEAIPPPYPDHR